MADPGGLLVHELIEREAAAHPDAVALVDADSATTYAALEVRANQWARRLSELGAKPEVLVGVHLERSADLVCALLGVLKAGAAYVPLDTAYPRERLEFMADDAAMSLIVSADLTLDLRTGHRVTVITPDECDSYGPAGRARFRVGPDNLAFVLYTSGSTGRPKGAAITHGNATCLMSRVAADFGADLDRVLAATSICFDCSVLEIFGPLSRGGTVVLAETAMDIGTRSEGRGVRLLHTVPSVVDELLRTDQLPSSTRTVIVGGERLMPGLVEKIYANSSIERLVNFYGPTECTTYTTLAEVDGSPDGPPAIGRPAANARVYLLDPAGRPAAIGSPGEVYVAGAGVSRGYVRRPGLTAERFLPDTIGDRPGQRLYRTGDLAYADEDGMLHFLGRVDDQLKVRGVRIEPGEVEQVLAQHPAVLEAAVVAGGGARSLTAYVVTARPVRSEELRPFVRTRLPRQLCPDVFVHLERLPRTPNGKVDRLQLPATGPAELPGCSEPAAPGSELESMLAALWAAALERDQIDVHDNVFDLGGHSLFVLSVRASLSGMLGRDLPVRLFFEHPTIAGLAAEIDRLFRMDPDGDMQPTRPVPVRRAGERAPLSPNQRAILARVRRQSNHPGLVFPLVVRLAGAILPNALGDAFAEVVRRHESLRTRIVGGFQEALTQPIAELPLVDLSGLKPEHAEEIARRSVTHLVERRFDIDTGPLVRVVLLRLNLDDHVLAVILHHLVADAWSIETLSHQMLGLYAAGIHGRPAVVPEPTLQYPDWAAAQVDWLDSNAGQAQLAYWRKELREPPVLRLPDGRGRTATAGPALVHSFPISEVISRRLIEFGRRAGATRYMVLVAAFAVLLGRRSGQTDVVIGCPTAGRDHPELTPVLGPCYDAFAIRLDLSGDPTFRELVSRVRRRTLDAYSNLDVPFAVLVDEMGGQGPEHPLFQASIVIQQRPSLLDFAYSTELIDREPVGDVTMSRFGDLPIPPTAMDIELALYDRDDELEGVLTCRSDVSDAAESRRVAADFCAILDTAIAEPHTPISAC